MKKILELDDKRWLRGKDYHPPPLIGLRSKEAGYPPPLIGLSDLEFQDLQYEVCYL